MLSNKDNFHENILLDGYLWIRYYCTTGLRVRRYMYDTFLNLIPGRTIKDYYEVKQVFKGPLFRHYVRGTGVRNGRKFLKRFIIRSL